MRLRVGRAAGDVCLRGRDRVGGTTWTGLGPVGRLVQLQTLVRAHSVPPEGRARGTSRGIGIPPAAVAGAARMPCHHRACAFSLPPAPLSPGVHVPSSQPSLKSVSTVAGSMRPLLTTLSEVSTPPLSGYPCASTGSSFPGLWSPSKVECMSLKPGRRGPALSWLSKEEMRNTPQDNHAQPRPRSTPVAQRGQWAAGPSARTLRTPAPSLLAAGRGHRGPEGRPGAREGTLWFCRLANPSRSPVPCRIDFQSP